MHAGEQEICLPADVEFAGHYENDGDEGPSNSGQHATHHHGSCAGHQCLGSTAPALKLTVSEMRMPLPKSQHGLRDLGPQDLLRPPIA